MHTLRPGMYLGLLHGRLTPNEDMLGNWGFNGPIIGPLLYVHTTYASTLKLEFVDEEASRASGFELESDMLSIDDDLLVLDNKYYGDWTVFINADI